MSKFSDEYWMQLAYEQAELAAEQGEIPVGAVIVSQNKLIGAGFNAPIGLSDPTAHAEIQAIRAACDSLKNYRLPEDATLYVTLEPCTMCAGAVSLARIRRLYYAADDPKGGAVDHGARFFSQPTCHHAPDVYGGLRARESAALLRDFFQARR